VAAARFSFAAMAATKSQIETLHFTTNIEYQRNLLH
jgi:hypothetical protein